MRNSLLLLVSAALLAGCGSSDGAKTASATPPPSQDSLARKPMTTEQKIAAIERSSAPEDKKRIAIERLRSGKP